MKGQAEIWKALPGVPGVEISTFGNVRTLDRLVSSEKMTRFTKGQILKQQHNTLGYLQVNIIVDGKRITKKVHRLVAQTFIPNPDSLSDVNHKNCIRDDNRVENLEWCSKSYNQKYREKYGVSQTEATGHPLFAINLATLEVSRFRSQSEAGRKLGIKQGSVRFVVIGKQKQTHGYWFVNADENADAAINCKLNDLRQL